MNKQKLIGLILVIIGALGTAKGFAGVYSQIRCVTESAEELECGLLPPEVALLIFIIPLIIGMIYIIKKKH